MGKKKEYKKPLLADSDESEDGGFGTLEVLDDDDRDDYKADDTAATSATSMFSSMGMMEDEGSEDSDILNDEEDGHDGTGDSIRSARSVSSSGQTDSAHKRTVLGRKARQGHRRSRGRLTQSPGAMNGTRSRRCDRPRSVGTSPGAISRKNMASPGAISRNGTRAVSNSPHHSIRRGPRARRRSIEGHLVSPNSSGHDRNNNSGRSARRKTQVSPREPVNALFAGNAKTDELLAPNLEVSDDDADIEGPDDQKEETDDADVLRDELADLEGLIQAAKGVGVS